MNVNETLREIRDKLNAFCEGNLSLQDLLVWARNHPLLWEGDYIEKNMLKLDTTKGQARLLDRAFSAIILLDPEEPEEYRTTMDELESLLALLRGEEP